MNQNYTYFFPQIGKKDIFGAPQNFSNSFRVPRDGEG